MRQAKKQIPFGPAAVHFLAELGTTHPWVKVSRYQGIKVSSHIDMLIPTMASLVSLTAAALSRNLVSHMKDAKP